MQSEKGSVLLLSLVVILVLTVLVTGLSTLIINEFNISRYEENSLKAFYLAEAGIERALYLVKNDIDSLVDISDSWNNTNGDSFGSYQITISPPENYEDSYEIVSKGTYGTITKTITVNIRQSLPGKTIISGDDIIESGTYEERFLFWDIEKEYQTNIDNYSENDEDVFNIGEFIFDSSSLPEENIMDSIDSLYDYREARLIDIPEMPWLSNFINDNIDIGVTTLPENEILYYKGDLNIDMDEFGALVTGDSNSDGNIAPSVLVVDGNLTISKMDYIKDLVFIVNGNFTYEKEFGGYFDNTFIYAEESVEFNRLSNDDKPIRKYLDLESLFSGEIEIKNFTFKGSIISKGNIDLKTDDGEVSYQDVEIPNIFNSYKINNKSEPQIISWQEE